MIFFAELVSKLTIIGATGRRRVATGGVCHMAEITETEFRESMRDVVTVESSFKVVFPWGFKIVELDGEKVLQPLTPEEYREAAAEEPGKALTALEIAGRPRCTCKFTNTDSLSQGCTEAGGGWCSTHYSKGKWYRLCNYL